MGRAFSSGFGIVLSGMITARVEGRLHVLTSQGGRARGGDGVCFTQRFINTLASYRGSRNLMMEGWCQKHSSISSFNKLVLPHSHIGSAPSKSRPLAASG